MSQIKETTAQIIFNRKYICQIQRMHTLTKIDTDIFGISASGDKGIDEALLNAWQFCQLTIAEMVEYHSKGVSFIIDTPSDTVDIYETIKQHISDHYERVKNGINIGNVPVNDLVLMDAFAATVYGIACQYKKPEELKISQGFQDLFNRGQKVFKAKLPEPIKPDDPKPNIEKHTPLAALIAKEFHTKSNR